MKAFISHRISDKDEVDNLLRSVNDIEFKSHRTLEASDDLWKKYVSSKMIISETVLFFLGSTIAESKPVKWEFDLANKLGKICFAVRLQNAQVPDYIMDIEFIKAEPKKIETKLKSIVLKPFKDLIINQ